MGATSVTGVSGSGSVAGSQKGSEHMSLGVNKLIGPHIVAAGTETLSGTSAVVELPAQTGSVTTYSVMLTNNSSTNAYISSALAVSSETDMWKFTVTAGNNDIVSWAVFNNGL